LELVFAGTSTYYDQVLRRHDHPREKCGGVVAVWQFEDQSMVDQPVICRICGSSDLDEFPAFSRLARVTSDCKPFPAGGRIAVCRNCGAVQKPIDAEWEKAAASIYADYDPYFQSSGVEQAIFDPVLGRPRRRSAVILDRMAAEVSLPETGSVLDVGCGSGALLSAFSEAKPNWRLFGHDLSEINLDKLVKIPRFEKLHTAQLDEIGARFDLVTMMHSLEHFTTPIAGLQAVRECLSDTGQLLIEVPNIAATPFDLLIADHVSHFTLNDLTRVITAAGLGSVVLTDAWVTKELSVVAHRGATTAAPPPPTDPVTVAQHVCAQIAWLNAVIDQVEVLIAKNRTIGLFGTSIAGMWLFGQFGEHIAFFVDEDPSRRGTTLFGRPVLSPEDVAPGETVFIGLPYPVAFAIAKRLTGAPPRFELPPEQAE